MQGRLQRSALLSTLQRAKGSARRLNQSANANPKDASMKRNFLMIAVTCVAGMAGLSAALPAYAQFAKPEDAVKYRKAAFTVMASHFGRINAMAQGKVPFDATAATANAEIVAMMANLPFAAFPEGTHGTEKGTPKANVWTERAKFDEGAKAMQAETVKLVAAAKSNNLDALKAAVGNTGKTCKACHDNFRNE
jgi:cytochrome c556